MFSLIGAYDDAIVNKRNFGRFPDMPGAELVKIPTTQNDKVQKAIDDYIKADWPYNVVTNNCADFVNDVSNEADDINLWDKTIPNDYFDQLLKKHHLQDHHR